MKYTHKRGDSLDLSGVITVDPTNPDMSDWTITAQVRLSDVTRSFICNLETMWIDATTGMAFLHADPDVTERWPLGDLLVDIRVTSSDLKSRVTSPVFNIFCVEDITRG